MHRFWLASLSCLILAVASASGCSATYDTDDLRRGDDGDDDGNLADGGDGTSVDAASMPDSGPPDAAPPIDAPSADCRDERAVGDDCSADNEFVECTASGQCEECGGSGQPCCASGDECRNLGLFCGVLNADECGLL